MAVFKRVKLFTNVTKYDSNNMMLEQVWGYRVKGDGDDEKIGRYRIRYSKSDQSFMFQESALSEADLASFEEAMGAHGPAISCEISQWSSENGWTKCLDWLGDPSSDPIDICEELNDQYRSFISGMPIEKTFYTNPGMPPASPNAPVEKKTTSKSVKAEPALSGSSPDGDLDWV